MAAAKQGYAKAQNHIGVRLARGEGIAKDETEALKWLTLAARAGHPQAKINRQSLASKVSADIKKKAEALSDSFKPMQQ